MKKLFILCAAAIFLVAFTAPSFAAEWSFYGSARMSMFWSSRDLGDNVDAAGEDTDSDLLQSLQGNSRIGANVKAGDNLVGRFEYGTGVNVRILWGEYDFGGFKLGVGQHYTPITYFLSNQVIGSDEGMLSYGGIYGYRRGMVQAKIGSFKFALVNPQSSTTVTDPLTGGSYLDPAGDAVFADTDISWPKLEASWGFNAGGFSGQVSGGYNQYKIEGADQSKTVDSYVLGLGLKWDIGPFWLGGDAWIGKNPGNYGMYNQGRGTAGWDAVDEKVLDNDGFGWLFVVGFKMSDMFAFEGGLGSTYYDLDTAADTEEYSAWYVQANIAFAKGVFIVPEIGQLANSSDLTGKDLGKTTYYGLKWQINF